jgi:hypothetical protein
MRSSWSSLRFSGICRSRQQSHHRPPHLQQPPLRRGSGPPSSAQWSCTKEQWEIVRKRQAKCRLHRMSPNMCLILLCKIRGLLGENCYLPRPTLYKRIWWHSTVWRRHAVFLSMICWYWPSPYRDYFKTTTFAQVHISRHIESIFLYLTVWRLT